MVAEVSTRGPDRLERELSCDVHYLIPSVIKDQERRDQMISIAHDLARRHGCELAPPRPATPVPPAPVLPAASVPAAPVPAAQATSLRNTSSWQKWFGLFFGCASPRISLRGEQTQGEKPRLMMWLGDVESEGEEDAETGL